MNKHLNRSSFGWDLIQLIIVGDTNMKDEMKSKSSNTRKKYSNVSYRMPRQNIWTVVLPRHSRQARLYHSWSIKITNNQEVNIQRHGRSG